MRRTAIATAIGSILLVSACGGSSSGSSDKPAAADAKPGATASLTFTVFDKPSYAIKAGQALTFLNANPIQHIIVEGTYKVDGDGLRTSEKDDGVFNLDVPAKKGATASHVFDKAGSYTFFCTIHKGMNATVVVS